MPQRHFLEILQQYLIPAYKQRIFFSVPGRFGRLAQVLIRKPRVKRKSHSTLAICSQDLQLRARVGLIGRGGARPVSRHTEVCEKTDVLHAADARNVSRAVSRNCRLARLASRGRLKLQADRPRVAYGCKLRLEKPVPVVVEWIVQPYHCGLISVAILDSYVA